MITIGTKKIGPEYPTYIIAEIGINYNGSLDLALKMVEVAHAANADAVKVQIIDPDKSYARSSPSYDIFKKVQMSTTEWRRVVDYAQRIGIDIFATFTHPDDVQLADAFQFPALKISSSNLTNFPLLKAAAKVGKPLVVSTGLSYLSEVDEAVRFLEAQQVKGMTLLHCTALYPAPPEVLHLRAIPTLQMAFPQYPIGYSDHTAGVHCSIAAVTLGARVVEKHFTLDPSMEGPDQHFSITPQQLTELVTAVREVECALGSSVKQPAPQELPERTKLQRTLVATQPIKAGEAFSVENIGAKRASSHGLLPKHFEMLIGRTARKDMQVDDVITFDFIN